MQNAVHQIELDIPIETVWSFVSDINNWAPLMPGYKAHEIIDDRQSRWKLHGDIGVMQKSVYLTVNITEWQEPTKVSFEVSGLQENIKGNGYFTAKALHESKTQMTGSLGIRAKGMMGHMVNPVLKTFVPRKGKELTEAIAAQMLKRERVRT
ncbi:hypothetical protein GCM10027286_15650 [Virgibacillus ainsalahensis]